MTTHLQQELTNPPSPNHIRTYINSHHQNTHRQTASRHDDTSPARTHQPTQLQSTTAYTRAYISSHTHNTHRKTASRHDDTSPARTRQPSQPQSTIRSPSPTRHGGSNPQGSAKGLAFGTAANDNQENDSQPPQEPDAQVCFWIFFLWKICTKRVLDCVCT